MRSGAMRAVGIWAGGAVAVVVVGLLATLLAHMGGSQPGGASSRPIGATPVGVSPTPTPSPGPFATPASMSRYVTSAVTANGVDSAFNPVNETSFFTVGEPVYVVVQVRNALPGPHRLSIQWFLNGQPMDLPASEQTSRQVTGNTNAYFALSYPQIGRGTARIYWDLPTDPSLDLYPEAWLARDVAFVVQDPDAPAPAPSPTVNSVSTPLVTPTPGP